MKSDDQSNKEIFCAICNEMVQARYTGIHNGMERYECPNGMKPGEHHGIIIDPQEEEKVTNFDVEEEKLVKQEEESFKIMEMPIPEKKNGFRNFVESGLKHLGVHFLAGKIFSSKKTEHPDPTDQQGHQFKIHTPEELANEFKGTDQTPGGDYEGLELDLDDSASDVLI
jgi:hypothetical protein